MPVDQVVRTKLVVAPRPSRTIDQRLGLRFPGLAALLSRLIAGLPPRSRVRQAALVRALQLGAQAYNRGDLDAVVVGFEPNFEYLPARNLVDAGLIDECYRGAAGYKAYVAEAAEVWGAETRFEPTELIDLGDRLVVLAQAPLRAQLSGVPLTLEFAYVSTFRGGRVVRQQEYHDHAEALRAAGLESD